MMSGSGMQSHKRVRKRKKKAGRWERGWKRSMTLNTVIGGVDTVMLGTR